MVVWLVGVVTKEGRVGFSGWAVVSFVDLLAVVWVEEECRVEASPAVDSLWKLGWCGVRGMGGVVVLEGGSLWNAIRSKLPMLMMLPSFCVERGSLLVSVPGSHS